MAKKKIVCGSADQAAEIERRREAEAGEATGGKTTRANRSAAVAARLRAQRKARRGRVG